MSSLKLPVTSTAVPSLTGRFGEYARVTFGEVVSIAKVAPVAGSTRVPSFPAMSLPFTETVALPSTKVLPELGETVYE